MAIDTYIIGNDGNVSISVGGTTQALMKVRSFAAISTLYCPSPPDHERLAAVPLRVAVRTIGGVIRSVPDMNPVGDGLSCWRQ